MRASNTEAKVNQELGAVLVKLHGKPQNSHACEPKKTYKPIKGMPTLGQIVFATTKYGKTNKCEYQHARFLPIGKTYSFSIYEITECSSKMKRKIKSILRDVTAILALLAIAAIVFFAGLYADDKIAIRDLVAVNSICFAMIILHLIGGSDE